MTVLVPILVAAPLLTATLITLAGRWIPGLVAEGAAAAAAAAAAALAAIVVVRAGNSIITYWFGGWRPRAGSFPIGIAWSVDRIGASFAMLVLGLLTAALLFSWRYLEEERYLFVALMLVFGAAMAAFVLSGDLFNMFVFFELMSVSAFALTAYKVDETGPLQGAFNFAVINTLGAFLVVFGIALLYGRTGSLNLAEIGLRLTEDGRHDGLVVAAFGLITCGFLIKAAVVPFHFWLADAHAAAPAPVCVLFSGVMVELGIYAVARIYWTVFDGVLGEFQHPIRDVLLGIGAVTAVLGAVMCGMQRHIKRLLAYSTIAHAGCFVLGVALLTPGGLAGAALFVLAHGLAKGALFLVGGVLLVAKGSVDELELHGEGRGMRIPTVAWFVAALALASPPFLGTFTGHALVDDEAARLGYWWVPVVIAVATIGSTAAIVRCGSRIFLGVGERRAPLLSREPPEEPPTGERPEVRLMSGVTLVLAVAGLATGALTGLVGHAEEAAHTFTDRLGYVAAVLEHKAPPVPPPGGWHTTTSGVAWSLVTFGGSVAVGGCSLYMARLPHRASEGLAAALAPLRAVHSGHIGDYAAWLAFGVAVIGGLFAVAIR